MNILIVDDEKTQLLSLERFLKKRDYEVFISEGGLKLKEILREKPIDCVLTDYRMPEMSGLEVLKIVKNINPLIEVVLMTAYGTIDTAVEIMKNGAFDFITKPIDLGKLEIILNNIIDKRRLVQENTQLKKQLEVLKPDFNIIHRSPKMEEVINIAARVAPTNASVVIRGESGSGKEIIARAIHNASERATHPFVSVNMAALPLNLVESELFGHEKGAFTGADKMRIGRFEEAAGGTLFLDELGDIPLPVQIKLLRVIQFGEFQRVGSNQTIKSNVRIISATHRDLEAMIAEGLFREDLFYRLNVITIQVPPLRERKEDIPVLAEYFIKKYAVLHSREITGIASTALDKLMKYDFPGNVRELENLIERSVIMCRSNVLDDIHIPQGNMEGRKMATLSPYDLADPYEEKMRMFETELLKEALKKSNQNKSAAARLLGISERHIRSRLERLGMK